MIRDLGIKRTMMDTKTFPAAISIATKMQAGRSASIPNDELGLASVIGVELNLLIAANDYSGCFLFTTPKTYQIPILGAAGEASAVLDVTWDGDGFGVEVTNLVGASLPQITNIEIVVVGI